MIRDILNICLKLYSEYDYSRVAQEDQSMIDKDEKYCCTQQIY